MIYVPSKHREDRTASGIHVTVHTAFSYSAQLFRHPLASSLSNKNAEQILETNIFFLLVATTRYKGHLYLPLQAFFKHLNENLTPVSTEAE